MNIIFQGDCLYWLPLIKDSTVDMCYIDPPYNTGRNDLGYFDAWPSNSSYIEWIRPRIELIHKKLKKTGSIFLHCDWHASHRLRCLLDEVFGENNFVNEIVWSYSSFKRKTANNFPRKHDVLHYYRKDKDSYVWNTQYKMHKPEYIKRFKKDENGRLYRDDVNPTKGGKRVIYLDEVEGDIVDSVWTDIPAVNSNGKEKVGYKTQKPEGLIKRVLMSASEENDVILDCFSGGFTTAKVCTELNRRFICGDVSPVACKIGAKRLNQANFYDYHLKHISNLNEQKKDTPGINPASFCLR